MRRMLREPRPVSCLSTLDCLISLFRALDTAVFLCGMHCGNMRPVVENSPVLVRKVFLAGNLSIAKSSTKLCMVGQGRRRSQGPSASRRAKEKRRPDPGITACPGIQPAYFVWIVFHAVLFCCGDILRKGRTGISVICRSRGRPLPQVSLKMSTRSLCQSHLDPTMRANRLWL